MMRGAWPIALALMVAVVPPAAQAQTAAVGPVASTPAWRILPAPQPLPSFDLEGRVTHEGARIWFAAIGKGPPVILLHGGDASAEFWGDQVPALLASGRRVILIDSRGHGRSTRDAKPLGYELMESDVIAVMDAIGVDKADVVGWSDGAILGLIMAMKDPQRVGRVFAFGANMDLHGFNPLGAVAPILPRVNAMLAANYARISPTPDGYGKLSRDVLAMQLSQPNYTPAELAAIKGPAIAIVDGAHEEFILREHTQYLARTIPGATLIILPDVSHFAPLQAPDSFNAAMIGFLDGSPGATPSAASSAETGR
jgi:pimeloyl-ACP methyl ester carboxylesterase